MFTENSIFFQMKTYCRKLQILVLLLLPLSLMAQKPADDSRTRRDVEVVRTVLREYFKEANPNKKKLIVVSQKAKNTVQYFSGFGLLIAAPTYVPASGQWAAPDGRFSYTITTKDCDCEDDQQKEGAQVTEETWPTTSQIESAMKGFVSSYNTLMGFLQPNERIVFYYDKTNKWIGEAWAKKHQSTTGEKNTKPERILLELTPEDLRLSGQELTNKLKITVLPLDKASIPEFEVMRKIFNTNFSNVVTNPFVAAQNPDIFADNAEKSTTLSSYETFRGLGVIYNFSVNYNNVLRTTYSFAPGRTISRTLSGNDIITEIVTGDEPEEGEPAEAPEQEETPEKGKSKRVAKSPKAPKEPRAAIIARSNLDQAQAEDKTKTGEKKAEEDYAQFVKEVKNYMIEYGRTLRSLEPKERLIVSVSINSWNNETLPKKVELLVQKSVLDEYDKRTLSLEEAAAKIELREYKKDARNETSDWTIFKKD